jgi:hypothetical protein
MFGLLVNVKPAWIYLGLYMDTVGLLVLTPRYKHYSNFHSSFKYSEVPDKKPIEIKHAVTAWLDFVLMAGTRYEQVHPYRINNGVDRQPAEDI